MCDNCELKKKQNPIKVPRIGETAAKLTNPARKDQSFLAPIIIRVKDSETNHDFQSHYFLTVEDFDTKFVCKTLFESHLKEWIQTFESKFPFRSHLKK